MCMYICREREIYKYSAIVHGSFRKEAEPPVIEAADRLGNQRMLRGRRHEPRVAPPSPTESFIFGGFCKAPHRNYREPTKEKVLVSEDRAGFQWHEIEAIVWSHLASIVPP